MTPLHVAVILAEVTAGALALRARERLLGALLLFGAASDVCREMIGALILRPERERLLALVGGDAWVRPAFAGATRAAFHVEQALGELGWAAAVAVFGVLACSVDERCSSTKEGDRTVNQRRPCGTDRQLIAIILIWALAVVACAALYPDLSGLAWACWSLERVYLGAHLAAAAVCAGAWWRSRGQPGRARRIVSILGAAELLMVGSGPFAWGGPLGVWTPGRWELGRLIYLAAFAAIAIVLLRRHDGDAAARPPR